MGFEPLSVAQVMIGIDGRATGRLWRVGRCMG